MKKYAGVIGSRGKVENKFITKVTNRQYLMLQREDAYRALRCLQSIVTSMENNFEEKTEAYVKICNAFHDIGYFIEMNKKVWRKA